MSFRSAFVVIYNNPFQPFRPFLEVDNDDEPPRARQAKAFDPFAPFTSRTRNEMATKALEQAERDLEGARKRAEEADRKRERSAKLEREATLAERKRILAILDAPVSRRHPRIAARVALESDSPAREAIAALEQYERENAAREATSLADKIVHMGKVRRGEADAPVTGVGPKVLVRATAEAILQAAARARGEG
jgi:hypothetical protein